MSTLKAISTLYLPTVDRGYDEMYIAKAFENAGIARLHSVAVESTNHQYNRVYVEIDYWHDTEIAYNFMMRLKNPLTETRIIHNNENELWWIVYINKFPHKVERASKKRSLLIIHMSCDENFDYYEPEEDIKKDEYYSFITENYAWVDIKLENMFIEERIKYEFNTMKNENMAVFC